MITNLGERNPKLKHRISYRIDIIPEEKPSCLTAPPFAGYYINLSNPLKGRFVALQKALEAPDDHSLRSCGKISVRVLVVDEQLGEIRLIFDSAAEPDNETCKNLEYEYKLLSELGCQINDWEIVTDADGTAYHAIRSEVKLEWLLPRQLDHAIITED
jgi:hypothetical protein